MPIVTELTSKLGIALPVVQGGMMYAATASLASAVSQAGGLGIIAALNFPTPAALRGEIRRCRELTSKPFGVNITMLPSLTAPDYRGYAQAAIDEGIKVVETAGNSPGSIIAQLRDADVTVLHKCTNIRHAQSAAKLGVDFLSIDGFECAGHIGESDITSLVLLNRARQTLGVPFIASGGFADGWGLAAALCLGACGVNMGTRFLCTQEAPVHSKVKEAIVQAQETDTVLLLRRWKNTTRLFKSRLTQEALDIETRSTTGHFDEVAHLVSGRRGRQVMDMGDLEAGVWTIGQAIGSIQDIPTCNELVRRIEKEAVETLRERAAEILTLDVFTNKRYTGNQVAVIEVGEGMLSPVHMQMIAREFNFSESVFLRRNDEGVLSINIFTPVNEMDFAGHPVIGTGHVIFRQLLPGLANCTVSSEISLLTKAGPVLVRYDPTRETVAADIPHNIHIHSHPTSKHRILETQPGLKGQMSLEQNYPCLSIVNGVTYTLVDFTNQPGMFAAVAAGPSQTTELDDGWAPSFTGVMYYQVMSDPCVEDDRKVQQLKVRMIAINLEDPACGSGSCALGAYLALRQGGAGGKYRFYLDQGHEIGRDSRIIVDIVLDETGDRVSNISLSGPATPVTEGTLLLPE
ncbi:hypothetical protein FSARC_13833 [Fusarium sarcochroum]|uniref:Nitronate monooxygenase domain-containing protein n=1 Tax=Fusarium sarcochroum TaxID=1208366 RepID=A0A8H4SYU0_9HYPO|nr:hypothetical protein FSARC_13833 [Fusarium sarcochroum]